MRTGRKPHIASQAEVLWDVHKKGSTKITDVENIFYEKIYAEDTACIKLILTGFAAHSLCFCDNSLTDVHQP